ncbi:BQ5605_C005g03390 [Microbotryum silenes-dioicae]|uniref:BQ5605_C005g03390 protein n=1 Tax=Microbotryum silenes-dioicae TaxID=796604 RepID=A0A2X0MF66_9BASI|nr:BQ5605_C005g03390 [Microbotryum silenes-dioicae]
MASPPERTNPISRYPGAGTSAHPRSPPRYGGPSGPSSSPSHDAPGFAGGDVGGGYGLNNASPSFNDYSQARRGAQGGDPSAAYAARRGSIPAHMQPHMGGYNPRAGHGRRASVVDIAAEFMGPQATEHLETAKKFSAKAEDLIDAATRPVRPWLPGLGRFLIVVTFLEDALRILTQLSDQNYYLQIHRGFPWGISHIFLLTNVAVSQHEGLSRSRGLTFSSSSSPCQIMLVCSFLVVGKKLPLYANGGLFCVVLAQGFGYGLIFDLNFFLRNLSVIGGLLMVLSDSLSQRKSSVVGIPSMGLNDADRKKYCQLAGRILLVFLFLGFVFNGQFSLTRGFVSVTGLVACVMVAVGYKAKLSALFLVVVLSTFNFFANNWWSVHSSHPQRDFLKYDFFQTLSIVGGLLLLVNLGPGDFSVDKKVRSHAFLVLDFDKMVC